MPPGDAAAFVARSVVGYFTQPVPWTIESKAMLAYLPEQVLWLAIRGQRLGIAFRRQAVVGPYIVEFLAPRVRLIVEVDGGDRELGGAAGDRPGGRVLDVLKQHLDRQPANRFERLPHRRKRRREICGKPRIIQTNDR